MNTLNLPLRQGEGSRWSIRHCPSLPERVEEARRALGLVTQRLDRFQIEIKVLRSQQVTIPQRVNYFDRLLPPAETGRAKSHRDGVIRQFHANFENPSNTLPGIKGSVWAAPDLLIPPTPL